MGLVKGGAVSAQKVDQLSILEKEIIRILLLFGNEEVDFIEDVSNFDEDGKETITKRKYQNKVSSEIYLHLQDDETEFTNTVFQEIYTEMIHQLNQSEKLEVDSFINHKNTEIAKTVTSILMDEEKYELSDWERQKIEVKNAIETLPEAIPAVIFNLRRILIEELVKKRHVEGKEFSDEEKKEIMDYTYLRIRLFEKLNRVV
jgi:DNA primase